MIFFGFTGLMPAVVPHKQASVHTLISLNLLDLSYFSGHCDHPFGWFKAKLPLRLSRDSYTVLMSSFPVS